MRSSARSRCYLVAGAAGFDSTVAYAAAVLGLLLGGAIGWLRGGVGFVLAASGWWFILALWAPIYGAILKIEFFQPLAALIGYQDGVSFFSTSAGTLTVSVIVIVLTSALVALGMAGYARIQKWCLYLGLIGFAIMAVLMLISSQADFKVAFDRANLAMFNIPGAYDATLAASGSDTLEPLSMGSDPGATIMTTLLLIPLMLFWILYPNWGSTLYGEVRGSGDFRKVLRGMLGGIWVTAGLAVVFVLLAAKAFGWQFFNATNLNYIGSLYPPFTPPLIPIWSYPPLIASYLVDSSIFQIALVLLFAVWFLGWSGTLFLSSTRMIFAAAFDRILPERAAQVEERRGVPVVALLFIMIPAIVVSVLYAYNADFAALTLDAALVIAVTFLGSTVAATILPWYKPEIFNNSPVAHLKLAISGAGLITSIILAWTIFMWLSDPLYADRRRQHDVDPVPRRRLWRRGGPLCRRPPLSALPGRRSRRDPRGDPGRVAVPHFRDKERPDVVRALSVLDGAGSEPSFSARTDGRPTRRCRLAITRERGTCSAHRPQAGSHRSALGGGFAPDSMARRQQRH